ncbi:ABC transporter ATP-binding protein [Delftia acidovorans]|uniref:ABC transporter ATP-binding protein n=1 Tax=Delftia acidovorans TaxID=80866 RepID=UPI00286F4791|nr:ABC transporter ATP-binding protein [Delftia acidovorans]
MSKTIIELDQVSKMYKLYRAPKYRMLEALGVPISKSKYEEFWPLRNISLQIREGERVGLIGRNGAGKSTTLKLIANLIQPTEGKVSVKGRIQALMELGTGFHPEFTGRENVISALAYQGITGRKAKELLDDVLDFAELEDFIDNPIKSYSAGMYSRLAFAAATAVRPEILIVDEILGAGDAYFAGKSAGRMRELTAQGATVLFVSHDMSAVQMICDRAVWIERGQIIADGHPMEVGKKYAASIRRQEELRLRAINLKLERGDTKMLEMKGCDERVCTLRLIAGSEKGPIKPIDILSISLYHKDELIDSLKVGAAADDDRTQRLHLLTAQGFMNWSAPMRHADGTSYRQFIDVGGKYLHAPFNIGLPLGLGEIDDFFVEIEHSGAEEEILLQVFENRDYVTLTKLSAFKSTQRICLAQATSVVEKTAVVVEAVLHEDMKSAEEEYLYGEGGVRINSVDFQGEGNTSSLVYAFGEPMRVRVRWSATELISNITCVICFYGMDGRCVMQVASPAFHSNKIENQGEITADFSPLMVGKGEYAVSVGIFDGLNENSPEQAKPLCVQDRKYRLKVLSPEYIKMERGIVIHPVDWGIQGM